VLLATVTLFARGARATVELTVVVVGGCDDACCVPDEHALSSKPIIRIVAHRRRIGTVQQTGRVESRHLRA
jgi:hypothetical protein